MTSIELLELYARYSVSLDSHDPDTFVSCFMQDAVVESPARTVAGHAELIEWMDLTPPGLLHQALNILVVDDSGSNSVCRADWLVFDDGGLISRGTYRDVVGADEDGVLRFRHRTIVRTWRRSPA